MWISFCSALPVVKEYLGNSRAAVTSSPNLPKHLLKIANCEDADLVQQSLLLLERYFNMEYAIIQRSQGIRLLITDESKELYENIQ